MNKKSSEKENEILLMFKEDLEKEKKHLKKIYIKSMIGSFIITFAIIAIIALTIISKIGTNTNILFMFLTYAVSFLVGQIVLYLLIFKTHIISIYNPFKRVKRKALLDIEYNLENSYKFIKYILSKADLEKPELDEDVIFNKNYKVFYEYLLSKDYSKYAEDFKKVPLMNLEGLLMYERKFKESFLDFTLISELTESNLKDI